MPRLTARWSEHEARKPYARPFGVSFVDDTGTPLGAVAVSGPDLLYYRQFKAAVLTLTGELFTDRDVDAADDPQHAWLDVVATLLPVAGTLMVTPGSSFDDQHGRTFRFGVMRGAQRIAVVDAASLQDYQEFQGAVAHQSGMLYRVTEVESIADPARRQLAWERTLRNIVSRPDSGEAMSESWPWR